MINSAPTGRGGHAGLLPDDALRIEKQLRDSALAYGHPTQLWLLKTGRRLQTMMPALQHEYQPAIVLFRQFAYRLPTGRY